MVKKLNFKDFIPTFVALNRKVELVNGIVIVG